MLRICKLAPKSRVYTITVNESALKYCSSWRSFYYHFSHARTHGNTLHGSAFTGALETSREFRYGKHVTQSAMKPRKLDKPQGECSVRRPFSELSSITPFSPTHSDAVTAATTLDAPRRPIGQFRLHASRAVTYGTPQHPDQCVALPPLPARQSSQRGSGLVGKENQYTGTAELRKPGKDHWALDAE